MEFKNFIYICEKISNVSDMIIEITVGNFLSFNERRTISFEAKGISELKQNVIDQIWFTEKDEVEQTDLYSLDDFVFPDGTKVRKDANLEKNYIAGPYGAIPFITNLSI